MTEWDIQPRATACSACQRAFADKTAYHTQLSLTAAGYTRQDLCADCYQRASRDGVYSYWQGEFKLPPPPPPEAIQKETAETLLRKLVESTDLTHAAARYILAVMLERKKILRHRETIRGEQDQELLVYEHARTGESFTLPDPHLRLNELEEVQRQVADLLQPAAKPVDQPADAG